jgi:hypothetical protein
MATIVQALTTLVLGCVAVYIAWRQWRTSHDRLVFDLFEKRFAVYKVTETLIDRAKIHGPIVRDDLEEFFDGIRGAEFLFDGEARTFLKTIGDKAVKANMRRGQLDLHPNHPSYSKLVDEEEDILDFLRKQDRALEDFFRKYLDLSEVGLLRQNRLVSCVKKAGGRVWKTMRQRPL